MSAKPQDASSQPVTEADDGPAGRLSGAIGALISRAGRRVARSQRHSAHEHAEQARERGNLEAAFWLLREAFDARADEPEIAVAFWDVAMALERPAAAAAAGVRLVERHAAAGDVELSAHCFSDLVRSLPDALVAPTALASMLPVLRARAHEAPEGEARDALLAIACRAMEHAVDPRNDPPSPGVALRLFEEGRTLHPEAARTAAIRALTSPTLHEAKRDRLSAWLEGRDIDDVEPPLGGSPPGAPATTATPEPALQPVAESAGAPGARSNAPPAAQPTADPAMLEVCAAVATDALAGAGASRTSAPDATPVQRRRPPPPGAAAPRPPPAAHAGLSESEISAAAARLTRLMPDDAATPAGTAPAASTGATSSPARAAEEAVQDPTGVRAVAGAVDTPTIGDAGPAGAAAAPSVGAHGGAGGAGDTVTAHRPRAAAPLRVLEASPRLLADDALVVEVPQGVSARVAYAEIEAVAVAEVDGLAPSPVTLVDLVLNWTQRGSEPLRIIRLRSGTGDFPHLTAHDGGATPLAKLLGDLLERARAIPLPDPESALGLRLAHFASLDAYQTDVLRGHT
jgi:hypothetical protein